MNDDAKRCFSRIGMAIVGMFIATTIGQVFAMLLCSLLSPELAKTNLTVWIPVAVGLYCCGTPVCYFLLKKLPVFPKRKEVKMPLQKILVLFLILMGFTYFFNFISILINMGIGFLKGTPILNPLATTMGSDPLSLIFTFIFGCVLSPIVEEVIFRKFLLDRLRPYGDKTAIWVSAIIFGLYHMNLSQLFYAVALGTIFAYATIKTNRIKVSCFLHIVANSFGMLIIPALSGAFSETPFIPGTIISPILIISLIVVGFILFFKHRKKTVLEDGLREQDASITRKVIYVNSGMIIYYILAFINFLAVILTPVPPAM